MESGAQEARGALARWRGRVGMATSRAVVDWDWTEDTWNWSPLNGAWRPEFGRPASCVALDVSTATLDARHAYDFWRELVFYGFSADRRPAEAGEFSAEARALISPRAEFASFRSKGLSGGRTRAGYHGDGNADLTLGFTLAGNRRHSFGEERHLARPGELYLYDASSPSKVEWDDHEGFYLVLRHADVAAVMGQMHMPVEELLPRLNASALLPFLRDQMFMLSKDRGALSANQREAVLNASLDMALAMLGSLAPAGESAANGGHRRGLMAAAERYIGANIANPRLDADAIARAVGCSRATLYRAFADQGKSVAGQIRALRMIRARRLLEQSAPHVAIAGIIAACGLDDPHHFSRMFRRQFGVAPKDIKGIRYEPEGGQ